MNNRSPAEKHKSIKIAVFASLLLLLTVFAFIIPLRPDVSQTEKRKLAKFPEFSVTALTDGSYFSGIATWFSDTVPFRDNLTFVNSKLQGLLGTTGVLAGFNEDVRGDEIPDPVTPSEIVTLPEKTQPVTEEAESTTVKDNEVAPENVEYLGNILICEDRGFEYYNFVQSTADVYVATINTIAAKVIPMGINVYEMIIPTGTDVTLNTNVREKINVSDQRAAIDYMLGNMAPDIKKVKVLDTLLSHRDEYIYYRTDHHWTALGAYYAYRELMHSIGDRPLELDEFTHGAFEGFLGSFYNDSGQNAALSKPDVVDYYKPPYSATVTVTDNSGNTFEGRLFYDETNASPSVKYSTFITGDNPYTVIKNNDMTEGKSCVVVKESFGNCLVPYLVSHYKDIYVVDYRYYNGSVSALCSEKGVDDLIILNNISMTRSSNNVGKLSDRV